MGEILLDDTAKFEDALHGLRRGDFSRLAPVFARQGARAPIIVEWCAAGRFDGHPEERSEAFTCACFLGALETATYLLERGVPVTGGSGTGLNAFHWAANRAQLGAVQLLVQRGAPLEVRNVYGGTVLGGAVWAAVHEAKPDHLEVIEALLRGGAEIAEAAYPTGMPRLDALLAQYGARGAA